MLTLHRAVAPLFVSSIALALLLPPATANAIGQCSAYGAGTQVGSSTNAAIDESSGVAASFLNGGLYWTMNDSGNSADLYAFDLEGNVVATYGVDGATNVDWEDLASGPCPSGCACLFIADIGDNLQVRNTKTIYRVAEPLVDTATGQTEPADELTFEYPDGRHDAETLLVDPRTGDLYVVTKEGSGISGVYRFPEPDPSDFPVTLEKVATVTFTDGSLTTTGGSVTADGGRVVIRTYSHALEWDIPEGQPLEVAFATTPRTVSLPSSSGGESITYAPDGMSIITTSEGAPMPVLQSPCTTGSPVTQPAGPFSSQCEPSSSGCSAVAASTPSSRPIWGVGLVLPLVVMWRKRRRGSDRSGVLPHQS